MPAALGPSCQFERIVDVAVHLLGLAEMQPLLLWDTIGVATAAVFRGAPASPLPRFVLAVENVPGVGDEVLSFLFDSGGVSEEQVARVRRTYEPARLIELAAIAIAGAGLHHAGGHRIVDVAVRGSGADYLVDEDRHSLEIAGRSRRRDLDVAWEQKWQRLRSRQQAAGYVCVCEFEAFTGRLGFAFLE
jgi:hypothetical protein